MEQNDKTSIKECYEIAHKGIKCLIESFDETGSSFEVLIKADQQLHQNLNPNTTTAAIGYRTSVVLK